MVVATWVIRAVLNIREKPALGVMVWIAARPARRNTMSALRTSRLRCAGNAMIARGVSVTYEEFFDDWSNRSTASARVIVPVILELLAPRSVIDVGCGLGAWLAVFADYGIADYLGMDGDYAGRRADLLIPTDRFVATDLAAPFALDRSFDLAVSLEVAEHLPPTSATSFVAGLVGLAPAVLFSAAIPGQTGIDHINTQWPEYWGGLFAQHGYRPIDPVRPRIWLDERVEWWYRQNVILYLNDTLHQRFDDGREAEALRRVIHPEMHAEVVSSLQPHTPKLGETASAFLASLRASIAYRLRRISRSLIRAQRHVPGGNDSSSPSELGDSRGDGAVDDGHSRCSRTGSARSPAAGTV